jgi:hypothetical protein
MLMFAVRDGLERGVLGQHAAPGFCRCSLHELLAALRAALRDTAPVEGFFARGEDGQYHPDPAPPRKAE